MDDLRQFWQMSAYNLGLRRDHPRFARFSYVRRRSTGPRLGHDRDGLTGLMLWFDNFFITGLPRDSLTSSSSSTTTRPVAFLAILIWHMYSTVFSPKVYP